MDSYRGKAEHRRLSRKRMLLLLFAFFCCIHGRTLYGQPETSPEYQPQRSDSIEILRNQYPAKTTWEHIVSFPGTLVSIPFVLVFKATEYSAAYIYEQKLIPKTIDWFTSDDGRREFYPTVSNRSGLGVEYVQRRIIGPRSKLSLNVSHSFTTNRQNYRFFWRRIQFREKSPLMFAVQLNYRFLPEENFYGVGPDTKEENEAHYDYEYSTAFLGMEFDLTRAASVFGLYRYDHNNTYELEEDDDFLTNGIDTPEPLPGIGTRIKIQQIETGIMIDSRNRLGNPTSGNQTILSATYFDDVGENNYNFWKAAGDIQQYIHFGHNRVLKVRVGFEITEAASGGSVPFYYLSTLGEVESIRGYKRGRFRDLKMALGSLEYTIPFWHRMDSFLFVDGGQVGATKEDFALKNVKWGIGGGLRIRDSRDVIAILQFAVGSEGIRGYLNIK